MRKKPMARMRRNAVLEPKGVWWRRDELVSIEARKKARQFCNSTSLNGATDPKLMGGAE
jgi:hypothetical protein